MYKFQRNHLAIAVSFLYLTVSSIANYASASPAVFSKPEDENALVCQVTPNPAGLGDELTVYVANLKTWLDASGDYRVGRKLPPKSQWDLVLFINGRALTGVAPEVRSNGAPLEENKAKFGYKKVTELAFLLKRNNATRETWNALLNKPVMKRAASVTLGFEDMPEQTLPTRFKGDAPPGPDRFELIVIRNDWRLWAGIIVMLSASLAFWKFASKTDLIRDTTACKRPDNQSPYSLARSQMAFWFFLTIASFFVLWIITGDTKSFNNSVLILVGISAGTALGAAVVDSSKTNDIDECVNWQLDTAQPRSKIIGDLLKLRDAAHAKWDLLCKQAIAAQPVDPAKKIEIQSARDEVSKIDAHLTFFRSSKLTHWLYDILGDNQRISFHRFQIFVWTLVLGIIFVHSVYSDLAMPEFDSTLLGLMGISAGTYIGFKLPSSTG